MHATTAATRQVAILLYPDVEVLDFAGPYEVFTTASRMALRLAPAVPPPFAVCTVARQAGPVRARAGLQALADHALDAHPAIDLLLVPGGVVDAPLADGATLGWLARQAPQAEITASVCTGVFLQAAAGLLPLGTKVTTHWEDIDDLRRAHPGLDVLPQRRYVDQGRLVSSAGISAGIDMSLHLVARLAGTALAERTARQMDVVWTRDVG
jgi:transcriptional regulator GlxA family with amidase domain